MRRPYAKAPSTWGLRRGSEGIRALSLSRRKSSTSKGDSEVFQGYGKRKSSISILGRFSLANLEKPHSADCSPPAPQRKLSSSIKAGLRRISHSKHTKDELGPATAPRASPSTEVLNKTAMLAPGRLKQGSILPQPKTHSTLIHKENCTSPTRSLGSSWKKKTAAAKPVLSPAPAQARDLATITNNAKPTQSSSGSSSSQSWGRRAAAVAFDIGRRRFNARKTSASSVVSSSSARLSRLLRTKGSVDVGNGLRVVNTDDN
ncbi:hypothetical protein C8A03DRAFT_37287 [Achaetomium macrosporum]|uniref:Uncharacterized protein n=1 Tax=Achaetomium macrosporum TaxID=79813 RepID=A0AAN7H898_9PEZI|nr:hypothetical protein C8A03DRAFT_37287 [Achaetomium macrosporum]